MGGCCCSSRKAHLRATPCPPALEERNSLTSNGREASALTAGLLVHLNLDTSTPDTYQSPPAPLPFDFILGLPGSIASESVVDTISCSGCKTITLCSEDQESKTKGHLNSSHVTPDMLVLSKSNGPNESAIEEDVCTICLEEYETENPKVIIKCEHYFHLSCILEWMERSDACPICDQEVIFDQSFSQ